ncbi:MAG TPA: hypothetical protein VN026_00650 [Bacteroidia bacterium]|jgi:hypothetical protein|nr:hypothetical protein [Bacteroidia bacterium]
MYKLLVILYVFFGGQSHPELAEGLLFISYKLKKNNSSCNKNDSYKDDDKKIAGIQIATCFLHGVKIEKILPFSC